MSIPFQQFINIKDNYSIIYFGENENIISYLKKYKPLIEKALKLKIFLFCLNKFANDDILKRSELYEYKEKIVASCEIPKDYDEQMVKRIIEEIEILRG